MRRKAFGLLGSIGVKSTALLVTAAAGAIVTEEVQW